MNSQLFLFPEAVRRDPAVERWLNDHEGDIGRVARFWSGIVGHGRDPSKTSSPRPPTSPKPDISGKPGSMLTEAPDALRASVRPCRSFGSLMSLLSNLTMTSRPVKPRARRMALIVASVPELTSRTFSIDGTASMISSASSLSASVGAPKLVPRAAASCTASRCGAAGSSMRHHGFGKTSSRVERRVARFCRR